jgi:hypothetical protein
MNAVWTSISKSEFQMQAPQQNMQGSTDISMQEHSAVVLPELAEAVLLTLSTADFLEQDWTTPFTMSVSKKTKAHHNRPTAIKKLNNNGPRN